MLQNSTINLKNVDIPIVAIIKHKFEKYLYCIGIESAIFTSAVSAGYGVLENISEKNLKKTSAIMCLLGIPIAYIGFGNLVNALYPVLGTIGIIEIILILKNAKDYWKNS